MNKALVRHEVKQCRNEVMLMIVRNVEEEASGTPAEPHNRVACTGISKLAADPQSTTATNVASASDSTQDSREDGSRSHHVRVSHRCTTCGQRHSRQPCRLPCSGRCGLPGRRRNGQVLSTAMLFRGVTIVLQTGLSRA